MIDFCEIDHRTGDKWQEFCEIFLKSVGYNVISPPGRGPDGGKDLLAIEQVIVDGNTLPFKWLVSCKHTAHSGDSIGTRHETRILDSVHQHGADGFMGFYSVGPTQSLLNALDGLKKSGSIKDYRIFNGSNIESLILSYGLNNLFFQFFPNSFVAAKGQSVSLGSYKGLKCCVCDRDILRDVNSQKGSGLIVYDTNYSTDLVEDVLPVCRQDWNSTDCVERLERYLLSQGHMFSFENLEWFFNLGVYQDKVIDQEYYIRKFGGCTFSGTAKIHHNEIIDAIGQYICIFYSSPDPLVFKERRDMYESYRNIFGSP